MDPDTARAASTDAQQDEDQDHDDERVSTAADTLCDEAPDITPRSYSLAEVAAMYLPPEWKDGARWLSRRISAGRIPGYRVGRTFRMTDADVDAWIESCRPKPAKPAPDVADTNPPTPPTTVYDGLTPRSRARLRRT